MGVAWQNCAYNQPPHLGYYLPDFAGSFQGVKDDATAVDEKLRDERIIERSYFNMQGQRLNAPSRGTKVYITKERHTDGSVTTKKRLTY